MSYSVYYDASGQQEDPRGALVIVGAYASTERWRRFERKWNNVLADFGVSRLHMSDFNACRGPFTSWRDDKEGRERFLRRIHKVVRRFVVRFFHYGVSLEDYHKVDAEFTVSEAVGDGRPTSGAYALSAHWCLANVETWHREHNPGSGLAHFFEKGDTGQGAFSARLQDLKLPDEYRIRGDVSYLSKKDEITGDWVRPLECVDFLAWETRNAYQQMFLEGKKLKRPSLMRIGRDIEEQGGLMTEEGLREQCARFPDLRPRT